MINCTQLLHKALSRQVHAAIYAKLSCFPTPLLIGRLPGSLFNDQFEPSKHSKVAFQDISRVEIQGIG